MPRADPGNGALASAWGSLDILHFADQAAADAEVARVLPDIYGGDYQAYYDTAYGIAVEASTPDSGREYEIDVIGGIEASAAANGVTIDTGDNMSYEELHAAYNAGTLG